MADLPTPAEAAERARRETVEAWVAAHPEWSVRKFGEAWEMHWTTVARLLHSLGYESDGQGRSAGWRKGSE